MGEGMPKVRNEKGTSEEMILRQLASYRARREAHFRSFGDIGPEEQARIEQDVAALERTLRK